MEAKYLNPFLESLNGALEMFASERAEKKNVELLDKNLEDLSDVHVFVGITGDLQGVAFLSCNNENALKLASLIACNQFEKLDDMATSALQEVLNMVSGGAATKLSEQGFGISITPPSVLMGRKLNIKAPYPLVSILMSIKGIEFHINLSLSEQEYYVSEEDCEEK